MEKDLCLQTVSDSFSSSSSRPDTHGTRLRTTIAPDDEWYDKDTLCVFRS